MGALGILLASAAAALAGDLHQAARVCDAERLRQLLPSAASLSQPDGGGMTPLHVAIDARQAVCVRLLLEAGADRQVRDGRGRTPWDAAQQITEARDRAIILLYLTSTGKQMPVETTGPKPWSLEYSVLRRQTNVTKMLLAMGADPNAVGTAGTTPLADASLKGDREAVRLLLAHGAKPDVVSQAGTQPIHDAALGDNADVIRDLIAHGSDVNARTRDDSQTPLHIAAAMGKMQSLEALVSLGADLTTKDSSGRTPLQAAERAGLANVAAFLKRAAAAK